jgi:hypothetical protein
MQYAGANAHSKRSYLPPRARSWLGSSRQGRALWHRVALWFLLQQVLEQALLCTLYSTH